MWGQTRSGTFRAYARDPAIQNVTREVGRKRRTARAQSLNSQLISSSRMITISPSQTLIMVSYLLLKHRRSPVRGLPSKRLQTRHCRTYVGSSGRVVTVSSLEVKLFSDPPLPARRRLPGDRGNEADRCALRQLSGSIVSTKEFCPERSRSKEMGTY